MDSIASGMIVKIGADLSDFDKKMAQVQKQIAYSTKTLGKVGHAFSTIGSAMTEALTVPIAGAFAGIVKYGSEYEAQMSKIKAITGDTAEQMKPINDAMNKVGMTTKYSSQQAAEAMTELLQTGIDTNTALASLKPTLDIASNGQIGLGEAAAIAARELNEFEMKGKTAAETAKNMAKVSDVLAYAGNHSAGGMKALSDAIVPAGGIAHTAGMSYEDLVSSLSKLSKAGYEGREGGQLMVGVIRAMEAPSAKAKKAQEALGVAFNDAHGKMRPMADILADLHAKLGKMTDAQQMATLKTAFTTQGMRALIPMMRDGGKAVGDMSAALDKSNGYASKAAQTMNNNLNGAVATLKNRFQTVAAALYTNLAPSLTKIVNGVTSLVTKFGQLNPNTQKTILIFAGLAAAIGPTFLMIAAGIETFIKLQKAFTVLRMAATFLGTQFGILGGEELVALWPIALIGAAIIGLIAIFVIFHTQIAAFWKKYLQPVFQQIVDMVVKTLKPAWNQVFKVLQDSTKSAFDIIKNLWESILKPVIMLIIAIIKNILIPIWKAEFTVFGNIVSAAFKALGQLFNTGLKPILMGIIDFVSGVFSGNWSKAWNGVKQIFSGIFNSILSIAKGVINTITSGINGIISSVNSIKIPKGIPGIGGLSLHIPSIPQLATGGSVFGDGQAIVGEAGPELITKMGTSVKVTPLSSSEKARGVGGALGSSQANGKSQNVQQIHNHFSISEMVIREEADIKKLAIALDDQQRKLNRAKGILV